MVSLDNCTMAELVDVARFCLIKARLCKQAAQLPDELIEILPTGSRTDFPVFDFQLLARQWRWTTKKVLIEFEKRNGAFFAGGAGTFPLKTWFCGDKFKTWDEYANGYASQKDPWVKNCGN